MRNQFIIDVANASYAKVEDLQNLSIKEIADNYILPKIVRPFNNRGYGARSFLELMAKWGSSIFLWDSNVAGLLFEIGMQRISRGALLHEGVDLVKLLPNEYKMYTFAYDEYRVMTKECYDFLVNNLEIMFTSLEPKYREHCHKIVFGIMQHVAETGETDLLWNDEFAGHTVLELRNVVKPYATTRCSENERWEYLGRIARNTAYRWVVKESPYCSIPVDKLAKKMATNWEKVTDFYRDFYNEINWDVVRSQLDLDQYHYYTGFSRKVMKLVGLYDWMTWQAIKAEMRV
jgi:hypothetical protein